jgi:hypothetical protein
MGATTIITGWLFDLYPSAAGITLWLVDRDGRKVRCTVPFVPSFFMSVPESDHRQVDALTRTFPFPISFERTVRREIYSDEEWNVLRVRVHDTRHLKDVVRRVERHFPHFV